MLNKTKQLIKRIPVVGKGLTQLASLTREFNGSQDYWESRYADGGNSGCGSYGQLATFKANFLNAFVAKERITSVVEFGCGDGNQLTLANYPDYIGCDVSQSAINQCSEMFKKDSFKRFILLTKNNYLSSEFKSDLSLSLDVIYHLVEDEVYEEYMIQLFNSSNKYVIIYSSNVAEASTFHVKHRKFTDWVQENVTRYDLKLIEKNKHPFEGENETGSLADFYVYQKR